MNKSLYLRKLKNLREQVDMLLMEAENINDFALERFQSAITQILQSSASDQKIDVDFTLQKIDEISSEIAKYGDITKSEKAKEGIFKLKKGLIKMTMLENGMKIGKDDVDRLTPEQAQKAKKIYQKLLSVLEKTEDKCKEADTQGKKLTENMPGKKGPAVGNLNEKMDENALYNMVEPEYRSLVTKYAFTLVSIGIIIGIIVFPRLKNNFKKAFGSVTFDKEQVTAILKEVGGMFIVSLPIILGFILWASANKPQWLLFDNKTVENIVSKMVNSITRAMFYIHRIIHNLIVSLKETISEGLEKKPEAPVAQRVKKISKK